MKIKFVGTSHGVPAADRFCSCTMIESGDAIYYIDAGAPLIDCALRDGIDLSKFRALFVTHAHSDHTDGICHFAELMTWYYKNWSGDFYFTSAEQAAAIENCIRIGNNNMELDRERVRFKLGYSGLVYKDENISVEYIPNKHITSSPSYSMLVREGDKSVLFSGDLSGNLAQNDVPSALAEEKLDAFICEMAHFKMADLKPHLAKCRADNVFFNHVFPLSNYDDIENIKGKYDFNVFAPNDGDVYEI